ncbi:MAG: hypothetical protein ACRC92_06590 [Peptostreptococcaceae bacterium]
MNILPIPWMKQKLEIIYNLNLYGNLYLMYNNLESKSYYTIDCSTLNNLLDDYNIIIDENHPLYLYFPIEINENLKSLILLFKKLYKDNCKIILGGYTENHAHNSELDLVANIYTTYPELYNLVNFAYLIDTSKTYEVFTSLSDTHRLYIEPFSSCTISGVTLNYHVKELNPTNVSHVSFVNLMDNTSTNHVDFYLKGLTNNNNNFNYNF